MVIIQYAHQYTAEDKPKEKLIRKSMRELFYLYNC